MDREKVGKAGIPRWQGPEEKCHQCRDVVPTPECIISTVFGKIMESRAFTSDRGEARWRQTLPSVPAVTSILLRQQNRRRWDPRALGRVCTRFPRLQEIHYEPWREWN